MKLKKVLLYTTLSFCFLGCLTGCASEKIVEDDVDKKEEEKVEANCTITECIKQIEPSNSVEEINTIMGFEGKKSDYSEDTTWKLDDKNWITLKYAGESPILQATIDKDSIKNEDVKLPSSTELKKMLNNGSFTYKELVEKLGGVEGTLNSKTTSSVSYIWVNKSKQTLSATFNNKSGKCTIASYR